MMPWYAAKTHPSFQDIKLRAFFGSFLRGCFTQSALLVFDDIRG
jgi:hypothetical protein